MFKVTKQDKQHLPIDAHTTYCYIPRTVKSSQVLLTLKEVKTKRWHRLESNFTGHRPPR